MTAPGTSDSTAPALRSPADLLDAYITTRSEAALAEILRRFQPAVYAVSRRILGNPHAAEDAVQATFLAFCRDAERIRSRSSPGPWLHGTARQIALMAKRQETIRKRHETNAAKERTMDRAEPSGDRDAAFACLDEALVKGVKAMTWWLKVKATAAVALGLAVAAGGGIWLARAASPKVTAPPDTSSLVDRPVAPQSPEALAGAMAGDKTAAPNERWRPVASNTMHVGEIALPDGIHIHMRIRDGAVSQHLSWKEPAGDSGGFIHVGQSPMTVRVGDVDLIEGLIAHGRGGGKPATPGWDLSGLKLAGDRLSGKAARVKADPREPGQDCVIDATVAKGKIAGAADGKPLSGWMLDEAGLRAANAFTPGRDWPKYTGPKGDWSAVDCGRPILDDLRRMRLVWVSDASLTGNRGGTASYRIGSDPAYCQHSGGLNSPVMADGRVFVHTTLPNGRVRVKYANGDAQSLSSDLIVWAVDAATGTTLWRQRFPERGVFIGGHKHNAANNTGCAYRGRYYFTDWAYRAYCLDGATGDVVWERPIDETVSKKAIADRDAALAAKEGRSIASSFGALSSCAGVILASTLPGATIALDADTGKELWRRGGAGWVVTRDGKEGMFIAGNDTVACVEPGAGKDLWKAAAPPGTRCGNGQYVLGLKPGTRENPKTTPWCHRIGPSGTEKAWELEGIVGRHYMAGWAGDHVYLFQGSGDASSKDPHVRRKIELSTGKIVAEQSRPGWLNWEMMIVSAYGRLFVCFDPVHYGLSNLTLFDAATLSQMGPGDVNQPHLPCNAYDENITQVYADGRIIFRGGQRLYCYDLRKTE